MALLCVLGIATLLVGIAQAATTRAQRRMQDVRVTATMPVTSSITAPAPPAPAVPNPAELVTTMTAPRAPLTSPGPPDPPVPDCAAALAYLEAHQAPGFVDTCGPGTAFGHYGVACWNRPLCPDEQRMIHIACALPFVYENEAHNSWTIVGERSGIDPFGQGSPAEQTVCNRLR